MQKLKHIVNANNNNNNIGGSGGFSSSMAASLFHNSLANEIINSRNSLQISIDSSALVSFQIAVASGDLSAVQEIFSRNKQLQQQSTASASNSATTSATSSAASSPNVSSAIAVTPSTPPPSSPSSSASSSQQQPFSTAAYASYSSSSSSSLLSSSQSQNPYQSLFSIMAFLDSVDLDKNNCFHLTALNDQEYMSTFLLNTIQGAASHPVLLQAFAATTSSNSSTSSVSSSVSSSSSISFSTSASTSSPSLTSTNSLAVAQTSLAASLFRYKAQLLNSRNADGMTPLHVAILLKHFGVADIFIANGADVNAMVEGSLSSSSSSSSQSTPSIAKSKIISHFQLSNGTTALHEACARGDIQVLNYIFEYQQSKKWSNGITHPLRIMTRDFNGNTPLIVAAKNNQIEAIRRFILFLEENASELARAMEQQQIVDDAADLELQIPELSQQGPLYDADDSSLHSSGFENFLAGVFAFKDKRGFNLFHIAAEINSTELVRTLIAAIPMKWVWVSMLNARDVNQSTPFLLALVLGHKDVAEEMLTHLEQIMEQQFSSRSALSLDFMILSDRSGQSPVHLAIEKKYTNIAKNLLLYDEFVKSKFPGAASSSSTTTTTMTTTSTSTSSTSTTNSSSSSSSSSVTSSGGSPALGPASASLVSGGGIMLSGGEVLPQAAARRTSLRFEDDLLNRRRGWRKSDSTMTQEMIGIANHHHSRPLSTRLTEPISALDQHQLQQQQPQSQQQQQQSHQNGSTAADLEFAEALADPIAVYYLRKLCQLEFSSENLDFLLAVREYRKIKNQKEKFERARQIYKTYVKRKSPRPLNIEDSQRRKVKIHLLNQQAALAASGSGTGGSTTAGPTAAAPNLDIFEEVEKAVTYTMIDTFMRFLRHDLFKQYQRHLQQQQHRR